MKAVAGFPDLHPGRHGPVGAAFLADRIWPQLVGPDIGCDMALWRLDLPRRRLKIDKAARRLRVLEDGADPDRAAEVGLAGTSGEGLGTIGGGNHFCKVQGVEQVLDPEAAARIGLAEGDVCLLIHSGSRGGGRRSSRVSTTAGSGTSRPMATPPCATWRCMTPPSPGRGRTDG